MSLIGKLLVFLNIFGAVGFVAVAAMDYGKRQAWTYSVLLHDVAVNGLPLDADEKDSEGRLIVTQLGEQGKADLFAGLGSPIATQLDEVKRYKSRLDGAISANPDRNAQLVALASILTPLAISNARREEYMAVRTHLADAESAKQLKAEFLKAAEKAQDKKRKPSKTFELAFAEELRALRGGPRQPFEQAFLAVMHDAPAKPADQAFEESLEQLKQNFQTTYEDAFKPALQGQVTVNGGTQTLTSAERKDMIASLLFRLTEPVTEIENQQAFPAGTAFDVTQGPYKRYLIVVGLNDAVKAIQQESLVLARIVNELTFEIDRERTVFVATHQNLVNQLNARAVKVAELNEALAREQTLVEEHKRLVEHRKRDIKLMEDDLKKLDEETTRRLHEVQGMSDELYKVRVATRNASEANQKFEQQIRTLEEEK